MFCDNEPTINGITCYLLLNTPHVHASGTQCLKPLFRKERKRSRRSINRPLPAQVVLRRPLPTARTKAGHAQNRGLGRYRRRYRQEILDVLDPDKVLRDLRVEKAGHDIVLLCFEKDRTHCHRGLVAEWFLETKGITVPELGEESGRQITI
jgi:hypothetical protein